MESLVQSLARHGNLKEPANSLRLRAFPAHARPKPSIVEQATSRRTDSIKDARLRTREVIRQPVRKDILNPVRQPK